MISIICASNNKDILEKMLIKSLDEQSFRDFELIIIDAKNKGFKSASETLNYGAKIAKGEYLFFVHQDIEFITKNGLMDLVSYCKSNDFGIAGVAGATGDRNYQNHTAVLMGSDKRQAGKKLEKVMEAYALDECLLIVKKSKFIEFSYLGETWHFYGPDLSNKMKKKDEKVLIFPVWIYHYSDAKSLNFSYFDTLKLYAKKNRDIKLIRTCCGYFKNDIFLGLYCYYRKIKLWLKKIVKRR